MPSTAGRRLAVRCRSVSVHPMAPAIIASDSPTARALRDGLVDTQLVVEQSAANTASIHPAVGSADRGALTDPDDVVVTTSST